MKMINDLDLYYANVYTKDCRPMWMKDERIDYCEINTNQKFGSLFQSLFHKKTK